MSATLSMDWLTTVDHPRPERTLTLARADLADPGLTKRRRAPKQLHKAATRTVKEFARPLAEEVRSHHVEGSRTIVVLNTVEKARELREALARAGKRGASPEVVLLHSRFRPLDREAALVRATAPDFPGIVVSTQVISKREPDRFPGRRCLASEGEIPVAKSASVGGRASANAGWW